MQFMCDAVVEPATSVPPSEGETMFAPTQKNRQNHCFVTIGRESNLQ